MELLFNKNAKVASENVTAHSTLLVMLLRQSSLGVFPAWK
jgi:hypothetical protein